MMIADFHGWRGCENGPSERRLWRHFHCFLPVVHLTVEILALRQQLAVMKRSNKRPKLRPRDRVFWVWPTRLGRIGSRPSSSSNRTGDPLASPGVSSLLALEVQDTLTGCAH